MPHCCSCIVEFVAFVAFVELFLPALELLLPADDWPLETAEPPTYVSFRHWPDGENALALRAAQVPLPGVQ